VWIGADIAHKEFRGASIIGAMEMSIDISRSKQLEEKLAEIGKKNITPIFNNIPNPVFVLNIQNLKILDCNKSVTLVYGYQSDEIIGKSFWIFFAEEEKELYAFKLLTSSIIHRARHSHRNGGNAFCKYPFFFSHIFRGESSSGDHQRHHETAGET